jgi:alpha-mannosidase
MKTCFQQLNFFMPVSYPFVSVLYDVSMGMIDRPIMDTDVPAQSFGMPLNESGESLMLMSDCKYGYRATAEGLSLTLIRSSVDPDPWPEVGLHRIRMAIAIGCENKTANARLAVSFCRGLDIVAAKAHQGKLPAEASLFALAGDGLVLSAVKLAEDGNGIIVRYSELLGKSGQGVLRFYRAVKSAQTVDTLERPSSGFAETDGKTVRFGFHAFGVGALRIAFQAWEKGNA